MRVSAEVDPHLEITEIVDRVVKAGGPALLFENPKSSHPLLINQFGTERRMCLAFGADSLDDVGRRLGDVLEMQPPQGLAEKVRGLKKLKSIADSQPKSVRSGPVQEVVLTGDEVDLGTPAGPDLLARRRRAVHHAPGRDHEGPAHRRPQRRHVPPAGARPADDRDALADPQGRPRRLPARRRQARGGGRARARPGHRLQRERAAARSTSTSSCSPASCAASRSSSCPAKTVDLEVPANAEIVLEGYIAKDELTEEGPFGDHTGYYTPPEPFPVFHVTAMTMRRDAIYPSIVVGKPPQEDAWLGKATERIFLPAIRMSVPEIVDYDLPVAGAFHNCCIVSIRKSYPGHAQKVMHAIWGLGLLSLTKSVVVVDEWVDVHDYEEVFFRVGANVDPKRDVLISEGPLDHLDHAPTLQFYGGKLGIDATHKGPEEGTRPWPPEIEMSDEVRRLVDERWDEYGLGAARGRRRTTRGRVAPTVTSLTRPDL